MNQVWLAFITGLTTGGLSCFAVQGGLLASTVSGQKELNPKVATISFLVSKLIAYTILGALLGSLGATFVISPTAQGLMQIAAGFFMLVTVGRLLDLHPIFRKFVITPPKSFFKIVRNQKNLNNLFGPTFLGFLTVLIPCGVTQAMMLMSIASSNPATGGLILGAFILGTSPVFFALGITSEKLLQNKYLKYAAVSAIFVLGVTSINTGQVLRGSPHTLQNYWKAATTQTGEKVTGAIAGVNAKGQQEAEVVVSSNGYHSSAKTLKQGIPVSLKLTTKNTKGCSRAFTIPEYGVSKILPETGTEIVEFTPTKKGRLTFTCSMGMYSGYFEVI